MSSVKCERTVTEREDGLGSGEVVKSDVAFVDVGVCRLNKRRLDVLSASLRLLSVCSCPRVLGYSLNNKEMG